MMKLKEYLSQNNIKQADFAREIGTTQATVSRLASEQAEPSLPMAVKIERATAGKVPVAVWVSPEASGDAA